MQVKVTFAEEIGTGTPPAILGQRDHDALFDNIMYLSNFAHENGLIQVSEILESALDAMLGKTAAPPLMLMPKSRVPEQEKMEFRTRRTARRVTVPQPVSQKRRLTDPEIAKVKQIAQDMARSRLSAQVVQDFGDHGAKAI